MFWQKKLGTICLCLIMLGCKSEGANENKQDIPISKADYQYQIPNLTNDGWQTADAGFMGVDIKNLTTMTNQILDGEHPVIDGIIIIKDNHLVFEHYFNGYFDDKLHELQSAVKSMDSALVGLAIDQGYLSSVNEKIYPLLPSYHNLDWSNGKDDITVSDLLTMQSGFPCKDGKTGDCNSYILNQSQSWTLYTLSQSLINTPGSTFSYFTGLNIVSHTIVESLTGKAIDDFAMEYLFSPLGISEFKWSHSPSGEALSGNMRPRDMAKFGQLYLNNGTWHGNQVISEAWITDSLANQVEAPKADGWSYGYWWWRNVSNDGTLRYYAARGAKDQYIFIVPSLSIVAVFTGNKDSGDGLHLFEEFVIPSIH